MSPRFPQELFDHIIDYASHNDDLKTYSLVCKSWSIRSRSHLFANIVFNAPMDLQHWCKAIPPTPDGPSKYVKGLTFQPWVVPLILKPYRFDKYPIHFAALTRVVDLTIADDGGRRPDMLFLCFSAFQNTLQSLKIFGSSLEFNEISRMVEFFPNLEVLSVRGPTLCEPTQEDWLHPPRKASFPRLKSLYLHLLAGHPGLDNNLLSGFAQASMNLQLLSITGKIPNLTLVQKLLDTSAKSLSDIRVSPLDLNLSRCNNMESIEVVDPVCASYVSHLHDHIYKPLFEGMLRKIRSPALRTITVHVTKVVRGKVVHNGEILPGDWRVVDASLCDILTSVRVLNPSRTFEMRIMGCFPNNTGKSAGVEVESCLPDFRAMGGVVVFLLDRD